MNLVAKIALGIGGTGATAASGYGIYELIRPKNIGEKLSWDGKILLSTTGNTDDETWKKLIEKYKTDSSNKFKDSEADKTLNDESALKAHCKTVLEKKLAKENEDDLAKARFWCVKNSEKLDK